MTNNVSASYTNNMSDMYNDVQRPSPINNHHFRYTNAITCTAGGIAGGAVRLPFAATGGLLSSIPKCGEAGKLFKGMGKICGGTVGLFACIPASMIGLSADCMRMATKGTLNKLDLRTPLTKESHDEKVKGHKEFMDDIHDIAAWAAIGGIPEEEYEEIIPSMSTSREDELNEFRLTVERYCLTKEIVELEKKPGNNTEEINEKYKRIVNINTDMLQILERKINNYKKDLDKIPQDSPSYTEYLPFSNAFSNKLNEAISWNQSERARLKMQ